MIKPHIQYNQLYKDKLSTYFYHINLIGGGGSGMGKRHERKCNLSFLANVFL